MKQYFQSLLGGVTAGVLKLVPALALIPISMSLQAQSPEVAFCDANYLQGCSALESDLCLEKYHACGRYNSIIQHFGAESIGANSATARYYKGVSYHGLFVRNRAYSLKCQYSSQARSELVAYLFSIKETGFRTQRDFDRVYQAAKIVKKLRSVEGCPETGVLESEIRYTVESYAESLLKSLFVGPDREGGLGELIATSKKDIQKTVGAFISSAAATQTQLEMRRIALQTAYDRLSDIAKNFESQFGPAVFNLNDEGRLTLNLNLDRRRGFSLAETKSRNWKRQVDSVEEKFYRAMGNMNINDYEEARKTMVVRAQSSVQRAAHIANLHNQMGDEGRRPGIRTLRKILNQDTESSRASRILDDIKTSWVNSDEGSFHCIFSLPAPWYCDDQQEQLFNLFPEI